MTDGAEFMEFSSKGDCPRSRPEKIEYPGHSVNLRVAGGATAGAMTAAVPAVALNYDFCASMNS
jgi:hypothetical protein